MKCGVPSQSQDGYTQVSMPDRHVVDISGFVSESHICEPKQEGYFVEKNTAKVGYKADEPGGVICAKVW